MTSPDMVPDARPPQSQQSQPPQSQSPAAGPPERRPGTRGQARRKSRVAAVLGKVRALLPAWRLREGVIAAVPALAVAVLGYRHRWVGDEGLVYARTAREVLAGHGPVFNPGERAEAAGGALWQWLLAAAVYLSHRDPALVAAALGLGLTAGGYWLATAAARKAVRPMGPAPLLPLGMLVLLPVKADWDYATSGLETGLATAWIALSWWLLVCARSSRRRAVPYAAAFVTGLGPLVRPGLTLVTVVFLVALWCVVLPNTFRTLLLLSSGLTFPLGYEIFRAGYYGVLVPLPAHTNQTADPVWRRGLAYFGDFTEPYRLWIPLLVLLALVTWAPRGVLRAELLAPPVAGLLSWAYVCRAGGDAMHGRMLLPGLFLIMLPLCAVPLTRVTFTAGAGLVAWAVCCALLWRPAASAGYPYTFADGQRPYGGAGGHARPLPAAWREDVPPGLRRAVAAAEAADAAGRDPVLVMQQPGGGGFVSLPLGRGHAGDRVAQASALLGSGGALVPLDGASVNTLGLAYPLVAHQERVGHAGPVRPADAAQAADPAWIVADWTGSGTPVPAGVDPARVAAARHALRCGRLAELQASVREPMTPERFWRNLTGVWGRTGFRYPADPVAAEKALCHN